MATSSVDLDRVNAQLPSPADDLALRESLEDARVLLWYATREGKQLPEEMVQTIVDAQSLLRPGPARPQFRMSLSDRFSRFSCSHATGVGRFDRGDVWLPVRQPKRAKSTPTWERCKDKEKVQCRCAHCFDVAFSDSNILVHWHSIPN